MKFRFEVQGSAPEPYVVIIERVGDNLKATCDCAAGSRAQYCKHRFELFKGSEASVIGGDRETIRELPALLVGTDVERAIQGLNVAEDAEAIAKKAVSQAKVAVARAMQA